MNLRIATFFRYLPELGEPRLPGVVEAGGVLPSGDFGAVVDAPAAAPVPMPVPVDVSVEAPELAPSAFFFALRSERFSLLVGLSAPVLLSVCAPALGLVTGEAPSAFELSGRAPPVSTLRPWDLSWFWVLSL
jgi:hypothetical protein